MSTVSSVGMLLTMRCNAACDHCCFESGPKSSTTLVQDDAVRFVRELAEGGATGVVFTGGEPFIVFPMLLAAVTEAGRRGLRVRVVTNGFWGNNKDRALSRLKSLQAAGLRTLTVSYDEAHEKWVPRESVRTAISTGLELGLRVIISSARLSGDVDSNVQQLAKHLNLTPHPNLWVKPGFISPNGRAAQSYKPESFTRLDLLRDMKRLDGPCPFVITQPVVTPTGNLAACCSPATATPTGFRDEFVVGSLHHASFAELQEKLESDPLFLFIMLHGPYRLLQFAVEAGIDVDVSGIIANQCDLCSALLRDKETVDAFRTALAPRQAELQIQALHLLATVGDRRDAFLETSAGLRQFAAPDENIRECPTSSTS